MRIDCVDENGRLQEAAFTKILEAASEVFRQEFDLPEEEEERLEVSLTITDEETVYNHGAVQGLKTKDNAQKKMKKIRKKFVKKACVIG